ncbi:hypothetical protein H920_20060 [Fukomys damarensis]|uniref:Uncharacterized protein n=1 Tax=Fukomys damarensis TaxID=885580 RepID=A0A091CLF6_FUKDA|nr:hypothetical protein H920_20060 [Fukomys damarensis]
MGEQGMSEDGKISNYNNFFVTLDKARICFDPKYFKHAILRNHWKKLDLLNYNGMASDPVS